MTHLRVVVLALGLLASAAAAQAQQSLSGWFHIVHGDPRGGGVPTIDYLLTTEAGETRRLDMDPELTRAVGGPGALDRRRVTLSGSALGAAAAAYRVRSLRAEAPGGVEPRSASRQLLPPQSGSKPYVAVLCRFADSTSYEPKPSAHFQALIAGSAPNGMDHFWREVSEDRVDLRGSAVFGWYDLPQPKAAYFETGADGKPDFGKLVWSRFTQDCTGVADADVDFSRYFGVLLQFNGHANYSWGGGGYLARDGVNRVVPMTWMASWATHATYAHEIGHSFGLPHSSGPYGRVYDSWWDVMSGGGRWINGNTEYIGVHTIGHHRGLLGWIPAAQRFVPEPATRQTLSLERSASPTSTADALLVQIPLDGGRYYSVEARRFAGYDAHLPGEAVVIHHVDPSRRGGIHAQVVDPDDNQNPNDDGAMWLPGEAFRDTLNGVVVRVDSATPTSYRVTVRRGYELRVDVSGSGIVSGAGGEPSCSQSCDRLYPSPGATLSLSAAPAPGWLFLGWRGHCAGTDACSVTLRADRAVRALFAEPLEITAAPQRAAAVMGAGYSDRLSTRGGLPGVRWELVEGKLPAGLALDATGSLVGTPEEAGSFRFTLRAVSETLTAQREFSLEVTMPALQPESVLDQLLGGGDLPADHLRFLDLLGNRNGRFDVGDVRAWLVQEKRIDADRLPPTLKALLPASTQGKP